jgi:hypothetical protein
MYRVEFKKRMSFTTLKAVPNVPCGVESLSYCRGKKEKGQFLMYRVELKVMRYAWKYIYRYLFLMYRVELKGSQDLPQSRWEKRS